MNKCLRTMLRVMLLAAACPPAFSETSRPAPEVRTGLGETAREVSDRNYLPQLRTMITASRTALDISIPEIATSDEPQDPVAFLLNDLKLAAKRGVRVRLFLNTFTPDGGGKSLFLRDDQLYSLRREGVAVHFVNPDYRLYDRLVVRDGREVLEGGLPWTREDLEKGLGSALLLESEPLAARKTTRLELLPLWDVEALREERDEGRLAVPLDLLREVTRFPAMVIKEDGDAFKIFLSLLRTMRQVQDIRFSVRYEDLAAEIPSSDYVEPGSAAFQAVGALERLEKEYGMITIEEKAADQAKVKLLLPLMEKAVVGVPLGFFHENFAKELTPRAIYVYLIILHRSQVSGESPVWLGSAANVEQDFPVSHSVFRSAVRELRRQNLIEVFPFRLQNGPVPHEVEYRYLINTIPTLAERLGIWNRMREDFGTDSFDEARRLADFLGEPEDPKVVAAYLDFLRRYPLDDLKSFTQHVAELPYVSTPGLLEYLSSLLEHETRPDVRVATA